MEVTVLEVKNPPAKPVLAIHAGSVRRQAKLEVNQPFVIPHPGSQTGAVEVSLFQQLASQVLPSDNTPESFCNIPVKKPNGVTSQVQLRVRRGAAANSNKEGVKSEDSMGVTRDYLDHHQLQQRIQSLIQDVLREQPENPYKYMLQQLRKAQSGGKNDKEPAIASSPASPTQDAKSTVPRPPEAPKPAVARGRPAGSKQTYLSETSVTVTYEVRQPTGEDRVAARFSMTNLLRMPRCQQAAEQSLRNSARLTGSRTMATLIMNSTKEKLVSQIARTKETDVRELARASMAVATRSAAVLLSPEYHRAVNSWARYVAYRGADRLISAGDGRRISLPTPIVFLEGQGASWGSWLSSGTAQKKESGGRKSH